MSDVTVQIPNPEIAFIQRMAQLRTYPLDRLAHTETDLKLKEMKNPTLNEALKLDPDYLAEDCSICKQKKREYVVLSFWGSEYEEGLTICEDCLRIMLKAVTAR